MIWENGQQSVLVGLKVDHDMPPNGKHQHCNKQSFNVLNICLI
jgi:hypothetical protein